MFKRKAFTLAKWCSVGFAYDQKVGFWSFHHDTAGDAFGRMLPGVLKRRSEVLVIGDRRATDNTAKATTLTYFASHCVWNYERRAVLVLNHVRW